MPANARFTDPPEPAPTSGYTQVVESRGERTTFVSGQIPPDSSGNLVGEGDFAARTRKVSENTDVALFTDIFRIAETRAVREEFVDTAKPPASTAVEVRRLVREEFMIGVEATAVASS